MRVYLSERIISKNIFYSYFSLPLLSPLPYIFILLNFLFSTLASHPLALSLNRRLALLILILILLPLIIIIKPTAVIKLINTISNEAPSSAPYGAFSPQLISSSQSFTATEVLHFSSSFKLPLPPPMPIIHTHPSIFLHIYYILFFI